MVDQLTDFADDRLINGCIYCGGAQETREHVPSRVFLDAPLPENLPIVPACTRCNNGFSADEDYLACLIECVVAGSTDPRQIRRDKITKILERSPALRDRIDSAKSVVDNQVQFAVEPHRVKNVLLKLAQGHAVFELSQPCRKEPSTFWWHPLALLNAEALDAFDACHVIGRFGEVGSRGMQRQLVTQLTFQNAKGATETLDLVVNDWVDVQEGRYRYLAVDDDGGIEVRMVIGNYLACYVCWG